MAARKRISRPRPRDMLTRERVIGAAVALLDRDGLEAFSLRRLADDLGVTPMALYNHVSDKRDLLRAVAEAVVAGIDYPVVRGDWKNATRSCFRTLRRACLDHPGAVVLVEAAEVLPASIFRPMEITLEALARAGLGPDDALRGYFLLTTFTLGQVRYQRRGWSRGVDAGAALHEGRLPRAQYRAVAEAAARIGAQTPWDFDRAFEFGLDTIVAGLEQQARGRRARRRSNRRSRSRTS